MTIIGLLMTGFGFVLSVLLPPYEPFDTICLALFVIGIFIMAIGQGAFDFEEEEIWLKK